MGLLNFGSSLDDPRTQGLLALGLGLMGGRGNFGQVLSQAGMQGLGAYQAGQDRVSAQRKNALAEEMTRLQMEGARQQQADQNSVRQFWSDPQNFMSPPQEMAGPPAVGETMSKLPPVPMGQTDVFRRMLQSGSPALAQLAIQGMQKANKLEFAPPGSAVFRDGEFTGMNVPKERSPSPIAQLMAERDTLPPGDPRRKIYDDAINKQTTHTPPAMTTVTVSPGERKQDEVYGTTIGEIRGGITKAGFSAPQQLRKLDRLEQLLTGIETGKLTPLMTDVASSLASFGIKVDPNVGNKEAAESISRELAGSLRQPGSGPMTDKDFENFLRQVPSLSKTAEGRAQIVRTMRAALQRDVQIDKMQREYVRKNGKIDDGFFDQLSEFYANNPVFGVLPSSDGWNIKPVGGGR